MNNRITEVYFNTWEFALKAETWEKFIASTVHIRKETRLKLIKFLI